MAPGYEYRGLIAANWDLLRGDTSNWADRAFYRQVIEESGQPVLDVGCGTGRLLLDYLSSGLDVEGMDVSAEMLALCRSKAREQRLTPRLYEQAMENMALPRRYGTIMVPSSSFQLVTDEQAAARVMSRLHDHLAPGGSLVMPFLVLDAGRSPAGETFTREAIRPADGALIRRRSFARYDPATQLEHTEDDYEVWQGGQLVASERHVRSPATRAYTVAQARPCYEAAGFRKVRILSGFSFDPYRDGDGVFTVLGIRG